MESSNAVGFYVRRGVSGETVFAITGGTITTGAWHHLAATGDGAVCRVYLDGTQVGSQSVVDGLSSGSSTYPVELGRNSSGPTQYANMSVSEVSIWSRTLQVGEVQQLARIGPGGTMALARRCRGKIPVAGGDPEGSLIHGKLIRGGLLKGGVLIG